MSLVEIAGLSYRYPDADVAALRGLSLEIGAGEVVVLAGASGSGKSTLLRLLSGLVPHFHGGAVSGEASVGGLSIRGHGPAELAGLVGTLLQEPETQVLMGTVRAELSFPLENRGYSAGETARAVEETSLALGIPHLLDRPVAELSGGELQRVALGAALVGNPRLLVLDEPTSELDPVAGDELFSLLRRLAEDTDTAILLSEHRLERCLPFADRVVVLETGELVCDSSPEGFLGWAAQGGHELLTPGARLLVELGLAPVPGVRGARRALRQAGLDPAEPAPRAGAPRAAPSGRRRRSPPATAPVLEFRHVWHELRRGPRLLRDVSITVSPGERIALMGRNGAGKSTLLRHAAGFAAPTRGTVRRAGRVAILLQNPGDLLVGETVEQEATPRARAPFGLAGPGWEGRHPRELSVGERQRLALAVVLDPEAGDPVVLCLDEPTRGMDRRGRDALVGHLAGLSGALLLATHDPELAAQCADRVILLADGVVIADGPVGEILSGGTYFATETARILGGAGAALLPAEGAARLRGVPQEAGL